MLQAYFNYITKCKNDIWLSAMYSFCDKGYHRFDKVRLFVTML